MVRTHYPTYIKTVLKAGAIFHLMFTAGCLFTGWSRTRDQWKNSRPKRRFYRAGKFDSMIQMRNEHFREVTRPQLMWQPNDFYENIVARRVIKHYA